MTYSIRLKPHIANKNSFPSLLLINVEVKAKSEQAYLVKGQFEFQRYSICWKCNRVITNEVSTQIGLGPDCATALNIPWDKSIPEIEAWKQDNCSFEGWIEKRYIDRILENGLEIAEILCDVIDESHDVKIDQTLFISLFTEDSTKTERISATTNPPRINNQFYEDMQAITSHKWDSASKTNVFFASPSVAKSLVDIADRWKLKIQCDNNEKFQSLLNSNSKIVGRMIIDLSLDDDRMLAIKTDPKWIGYPFVNECKNVHGRKWNDRDKVNEFPVNLKCLADLKEIAMMFNLDVVIQPNAQDKINALVEQYQKRNDFIKDNAGVYTLEDIKQADINPNLDVGIKEFTPRDYQRRAIVFMAALLNLEIGLKDE